MNPAMILAVLICEKSKGDVLPKVKKRRGDGAVLKGYRGTT